MAVEWRFEVAEENLKVLVAALHCLAQIGKELSLECECPTAGGGARLTLRALNDAHSASAQIALERSFFSAAGGGADGSMGALRAALGGRTPFVKCKVYAKACCNVFRTLKHVRGAELAFVLDELSAAPADGALDHDPTPREGRDGDSQDAEVDVDCTEIRWRLSCDFDITKTHRMKVHSCQIMDAVFDKRGCPSHWSTRQYHLSSLLAHIHHTTEVLVACSPTHVKFESYFPNAGDGKTQLHTETAVEVAEFSEYVLSPTQNSSNASVQLVFSLKEVKSLLAFCKSSDILEIKFYYSNDGWHVAHIEILQSTWCSLTSCTLLQPRSVRRRVDSDGKVFD